MALFATLRVRNFLGEGSQAPHSFNKHAYCPMLAEHHAFFFFLFWSKPNFILVISVHQPVIKFEDQGEMLLLYVDQLFLTSDHL